MSLSVRDAAREEPSAMALVTPSTTTTWAALSEKVGALRTALRHAGVLREPLVAFSAPVAADTVLLALTLVDAGTPFMPLHPRLPRDEQRRDAELAGVTRLLGPGEIRGWLDDVARPEASADVPADDERALAVLQTSGTSGPPRAVELSRRAFVASARASSTNLGWEDDDRWLLALTPAHVGGLSVVTRCLLARRAIALPEDLPGERIDVRQAIEATRATLVSLVPAQLDVLLAADPPWHPPAFLRVVLLGGASAPASLLERARERGVPVLTTYGLTEACSQVTAVRPGAAPSPSRGAGPPLPGTEIRIVGGRIHVRGPTLLTRHRPPTSAPPLHDGWLVTSDLGDIDAEGNLHVHGRADDVIVTGGESVHPTDIERVLESLDGVRHACAFGVQDERWGAIVAAALVLEAPLDRARLARRLAAALPTHRRPRLVAVLPELPVGPRGKVARREVRAAALPLLQRLE